MCISLLIYFYKLFSRKKGVFIDSDTYGKEKSKELLGYLSNNDTDGLKSMFCDLTLSLKTFNNEIQIALDFFDGRVISYNINGINSGESIKDGKRTKMDISPYITDIITDTNYLYELIYYYYIINEEYPEKFIKTIINIYTVNYNTVVDCMV